MIDIIPRARAQTFETSLCCGIWYLYSTDAMQAGTENQNMLWNQQVEYFKTPKTTLIITIFIFIFIRHLMVYTSCDDENDHNNCKVKCLKSNGLKINMYYRPLKWEKCIFFTFLWAIPYCLYQFFFQYFFWKSIRCFSNFFFYRRRAKSHIFQYFFHVLYVVHIKTFINIIHDWIEVFGACTLLS